MSSNDVVWVMCYEKMYHVFYSVCVDNEPKKPNYNNRYYKMFVDRKEALSYAHDVNNEIDEEYLEEGYPGIEYGVMEIGRKELDKNRMGIMNIRINANEKKWNLNNSLNLEESKCVVKVIQELSIFKYDLIQHVNSIILKLEKILGKK